jgi:N-acetylglutamate synthase-like GNAT family acetyltransferase
MSTEQIDIVPFNASLAEHFSQLNLAWLQKYFVVEPIDHEMLSDPQRFIIDKGGYVFFAVLGGEVVGTFAMMKVEDGVFELSKMAVSEAHQGKKVGNVMLQFSLEKAKALQAKKVILFSNTILEPAIHLYRKFGFREVPLDNSEYKRSNIKMEVDIQP